MSGEGRSTAQTVGLMLGPVLALAISSIPVSGHVTPEGDIVGLTPEGLRVAALLAWMAVWWSTEAIPIPATSLLPIIALPLIGGGTPGQAAEAYFSTTVGLLFGGFVVAMGIERWNLHKRIALNIVSVSGDRLRLITAGFMVASALISAWISNTATTIMMVPIALSVAASTGDTNGRFSKSLLLGICYACSIGGMATPIGTPTNLIARDWLRDNAGASIGFLEWMMFGVPAVILIIPVAWYVVTRGMASHAEGHGGGHSAQETVRAALKSLGKITIQEQRVAAIFGLVASLWVLRVPAQKLGLGSVPGFSWVDSVTDMGIAVFGAVLAFLIPAGGKEKRALLNWEEAEKLPWGVLLLFGGGISLGRAVSRTGLSEWIGNEMNIIAGLPVILIVLVAVALVVYLTEVTSNVATMTTLAPILGAFAVGLGMAPESLLGPAALAASCAFMLPVATAPNAIVYASGRVAMSDMIKAGFWINIGALIIITLIGTYLAPLVL